MLKPEHRALEWPYTPTVDLLQQQKPSEIYEPYWMNPGPSPRVCPLRFLAAPGIAAYMAGN